MRPLNTRERRIQFTRFLLLFLLAALPMVALVWLFGRVDHVENDFLRKQYGAKLVQEMDQEKFDKALNDVTGRAEDIMKLINEKRGELVAMTGKRCDGELQNVNNDLDKAMNGFQSFSATGGANKAVYDVAKLLSQCTDALKEVYKEGYTIVSKRDDDLKRTKEELEDTDKKLKECERNNVLNGN